MQKCSCKNLSELFIWIMILFFCDLGVIGDKKHQIIAAPFLTSPLHKTNGKTPLFAFQLLYIHKSFAIEKKNCRLSNMMFLRQGVLSDVMGRKVSVDI